MFDISGEGSSSIRGSAWLAFLSRTRMYRLFHPFFNVLPDIRISGQNTSGQGTFFVSALTEEPSSTSITTACDKNSFYSAEPEFRNLTQGSDGLLNVIEDEHIAAVSSRGLLSCDPMVSLRATRDSRICVQGIPYISQQRYPCGQYLGRLLGPARATIST